MIKIIDYGLGNCGSVYNMLRSLGLESEIIDNPNALVQADAIILPGVGKFDYAASKIEKFKGILTEKVIGDAVPFLGICLGMQLLLEHSEEGDVPGFGWFAGAVKKFNFNGLQIDRSLPVPHMGWNLVSPTKESPLFDKSTNHQDRYYFVHSYHVECEEINDVTANAFYGYDFACAIQKKNIFGVQFHPEKSHRFGKQLFIDFLEYAACSRLE